MKIAITVGHSVLKSGLCTSAGGWVQEYSWCKSFAPILAQWLREAGHAVEIIICPEKVFTKSTEERTYKLSKINGKGYDLVIELHLNSYDGKAKGTEVLYYSKKGEEYAERIVDKLDDIFTRRGAKKRSDLYMLKGTDCPAIMVEAFFCDNKEDYIKADEPHEMKLIAKKIAEGTLNKSLGETVTEGSVPQKYKNCVVYSGDEDYVSARVLSWYKDKCALINIKDYRSYMIENVFVVGGVADNLMKKYPDRYTTFNGDDRRDTLRKVLKYVEFII